MNTNLIIDTAKLFLTIKNVVLGIDEELREINKSGIFFAPEQYLAFEIGKALYKDKETIFGTEGLDWIREKNLSNGGPSDLIFETSTETLVFEFKISDTWMKYNADIKKLERLMNSGSRTYKKFFVALIDQLPNKHDGRIDYLEKSNQRCLGKEAFEVQYSEYKRKVNCVLVLYQVN